MLFCLTELSRFPPQSHLPPGLERTVLSYPIGEFLAMPTRCWISIGVFILLIKSWGSIIKLALETFEYGKALVTPLLQLVTGIMSAGHRKPVQVHRCCMSTAYQPPSAIPHPLELAVVR